MIIRQPEEGDWQEVLRLARLMHAESYFRDFDFMPSKVYGVFEQARSNPMWFGLVAGGSCGSSLAGFFCAAATPHYFGNDLYACDLVLYVDPEHRGSIFPVRMIRAYEIWARSIGCREAILGVSTEINTKRTGAFYERLGYDRNFPVYRKILGSP